MTISPNFGFVWLVKAHSHDWKHNFRKILNMTAQKNSAFWYCFYWSIRKFEYNMGSIPMNNIWTTFSIFPFQFCTLLEGPLGCLCSNNHHNQTDHHPKRYKHRKKKLKPKKAHIMDSKSYKQVSQYFNSLGATGH